MYLQPAHDLFLFAVDLRRIVQSSNPITQGIAFAQGRTYGLKISTLAGMAHRSESHVRRMLILLTLARDEMTAIEEGAPYTPILERLRRRHRHRTNDGSDPRVIEPAKAVTWPIAAF
jgi:hypothetical protein